MKALREITKEVIEREGITNPVQLVGIQVILFGSYDDEYGHYSFEPFDLAHDNDMFDIVNWSAQLHYVKMIIDEYGTEIVAENGYNEKGTAKEYYEGMFNQALKQWKKPDRYSCEHDLEEGRYKFIDNENPEFVYASLSMELVNDEEADKFLIYLNAGNLNLSN
jgi:hypothetical protein